MKKYFIHRPLFRLLAPPVYGVLVYLLILLLNNEVKQVTQLFTTEEVYVCIGLSYLSFESIRLLIVLIDRYADRIPLRIALQLLITSLASVSAVLLALKFYFEYAVGFSMPDAQALVFGAVYFVTALAYNLLFFSNHYLQKENTLKIAAEKQQREVLESEILEFRNNINPDLLYEGLENLIALMYRDVEKAEEYVDDLASVYRYMLTNRHRELVPVQEEIEASRIVIRLLNDRYNGQLRLHADATDENTDAMLIPGSLPAIVEAMVRNTIVSRVEPFVIRCYREDDYFVLQCRLNDRLSIHASSEMAVTRLQRSYSLYSDLPVIRVKAYQENYVKLPLIRVTEDTAVNQHEGNHN